MYVKLFQEWLRSTHIAGPHYSNSLGESYARAFAAWLDERAAQEAGAADLPKAIGPVTGITDEDIDAINLV